MSRIFISYRRADNRHVVDRIYDRLVNHFGQERVFKDIDSIPLGVDFRRMLEREIDRCHAVVVVIGQRWLRVKGPTGLPRLEEPNDFVRVEIEIALSRRIPVIPLLVDGATVPAEDELPASIRPLAFRNGTPVRHDPDFHPDMDRVVRSLEKLLAAIAKRPNPSPAATTRMTAKPRTTPAAPKAPPRRGSGGLVVLWFLTAALFIGLVEAVFIQKVFVPPDRVGAVVEATLTKGSWWLHEVVPGGGQSYTEMARALEPGTVWTFYPELAKCVGIKGAAGGGAFYFPSYYLSDWGSNVSVFLLRAAGESRYHEFQVVECNETRLELRPKDEGGSKDLSVYKFIHVPRATTFGDIILGEPRIAFYGAVVPMLLALALTGFLRHSYRHSRWLTFFLTLLVMPLLGGLLGVGYGFALDSLWPVAGHKEYWPSGGVINLALSVPLALVLAIIFTCLAGPRRAEGAG